MFASKAAHV